jgi:hypothetical protein
MLLRGLLFAALLAVGWALPTPAVQALPPTAQHIRHGTGLATVGHKMHETEHAGTMRIEAVDKVKQLQRTRAMEWQYRMQHVEELLEAYKVRHQACVDSKTLPGPYITLVMPDDGAGIGNQLPGVVSGIPARMHAPPKCNPVCDCDTPSLVPGCEHWWVLRWRRALLLLLFSAQHAPARVGAETCCCSCLQHAMPLSNVTARAAALLLALLTERCLFVDFPFFNSHFAHELDFSWERHAARLLGHGYNVSERTDEIPWRISHGWSSLAENWMFDDLKQLYAPHYAIEYWQDLDYSAGWMQSNPHYRVRPGRSALHACIVSHLRFCTPPCCPQTEP